MEGRERKKRKKKRKGKEENIKRKKESRKERLTFQRGKCSFLYANVLGAFFVLVLSLQVDSDNGVLEKYICRR